MLCNKRDGKETKPKGREKRFADPAVRNLSATRTCLAEIGYFYRTADNK